MADSKYFRYCRPNVVSVAYTYICMCVLPPYENVKPIMPYPDRLQARFDLLSRVGQSLV